MSFVLPLRPSRSAKAPKTPKAIRTTKTLQPSPESSRRRPSLATRAGIVKHRSNVVTIFNAPSMSFFEAMFGDDFPDAFANGDGRSCKSKKTLLDLSAEVLEIISQSLLNVDIKRLRFTCRELAEKVGLRIDRVYISPNRVNLDCLNNILNHPRYHLQVQEVVWDDAKLEKYRTAEEFRQALDFDDQKARVALEDHLQTLIQTGGENDAEYQPISVEDCTQEDGGLTDIGKAVLLRADDRKSRDIIAGNAARMSIEESYVLYQKLYQDEKEIIKRGWDVSGLQRALTQLPNLKRITLTSEVWRPWNLVPIYNTPFFRALPAGFRKPSLWPWTDRDSYPTPQTHTQYGEPRKQQTFEQHLTAQWRGYSIIMSSLATYPVPRLEEFVVDVGNESIGLPYQLFTSPNEDYNNTIRVLSIVPLKKLQLSLIDNLAFTSIYGPISTKLDLFKYLISLVPNLEHLDLSWNIAGQEQFPLEDGFLQHKCCKLKHIALRRSTIGCDWLFNLITNSRNLKTIMLDKVVIVHPGHHPFAVRESLFARLRSHFAGISYQGPRVTWIEPPSSGLGSTRWEVLDDELDAFLYDGGESPWQEYLAFAEQHEPFRPGFGWIMDGRDPTFRQKRSKMINGAESMSTNGRLVHGTISSHQSDAPPKFSATLADSMRH